MIRKTLRSSDDVGCDLLLYPQLWTFKSDRY
jgi:hypothetical protein